MKDMNKVIAGVAGVAVVAAIVIAGSAYATAKKTNYDVHLNSKVEVVTSAEAASAETAAADYRQGMANITMDNGKFGGAAGIYTLGANGSARDYVAVDIDSAFTINEYNEDAGYITYANDNADYRVINVASADVPLDAVIELTDGEGNPMIAGQKKVANDTAVSVMATNFDSENLDAVKAEVRRICDSATLSNGKMTLFVIGNAINAYYASSVVVTSDVLSVGQGENAIYVAPYTKSLTGAGFADDIEVNTTMTVKAGKYQDAESGLMPYIYNSDAGTAKIVAANVDTLKAAFAPAEPVIK